MERFFHRGGRGRPSTSMTALWVACAAAVQTAVAQLQYFEPLTYRDPTQCERMQCLSIRLDYCRDHLQGYYLKEKGCRNGQICTDCTHGNGSSPTICRCENPPYSVPVSYNQECNAGKVCGPGQGQCYRPCLTYLHVTMCPDGHCQWDPVNTVCRDKPPPVITRLWADAEYADTVSAFAENIVVATPTGAFPIDFDHFEKAATGYKIQGKLLDNITQLETVFLNLDVNNDGLLSSSEYAALPNILGAIDTAMSARTATAAASAAPPPEGSAAARLLTSLPRARDGRLLAAASMDDVTTEEAVARQLQLNASQIPVTPESCGAQRPRRYFCSFDSSCKLDCKECGWKSATDVAFSTCVRPSPTTCWADGGQLYCQSDDSCHPPGDCANCVDRPIVDYSQYQCLALWWDPKPLEQWTNWVCRYRSKVGMPCNHDQDCIYGLKRCFGGKCASKQPYNVNHTCESDYDCPHLNYYCPTDPTNGSNPFFIQYCRRQKGEGMTCQEDRECEPEYRCNTAEAQPRCRRLFSLEQGAPAADDVFCTHGWRDRTGLCAPAAKSKEAGRSCDSDRGCPTTDRTGRTGNCVCKAWWDKDEAKYCEPVAGDYEDHQRRLRDFLYYKVTNCGHFWTEEECIQVYGNKVLKLKLEIDCEKQRLSNGPYLPPADCAINDYERFGDACARLSSLR
eukprot:TRINITY_DN111233_c0_g1_i1.p1 TRINITY_DN111233_c0_g1~~TRINITY_DN111233_c0_g1_i1.p1  ORF type:complete len:693 (+),score=98.98 TRINITY_DN111233_c0_g1_i1:43-2079(+)